jgi:hypothetical protein
MVGDQAFHRLDHRFNALVRAEQPKSEQDATPIQAQARFVGPGILQGHRRRAMVDSGDALRGYPIALHQELTGPLRHHHHLIRPSGQGDEHAPLALRRLIEDRVQGDHEGLAQALHQLQHIRPVRPAEDPILMLETHPIDGRLVQVSGGRPVILRDIGPDLENHLGPVIVALRGVGEGDHLNGGEEGRRIFRPSLGCPLGFCHRLRQIMGERRDPARTGHVGPHQRDAQTLPHRISTSSPGFSRRKKLSSYIGACRR